jgi:hypothetical protein
MIAEQLVEGVSNVVTYIFIFGFSAMVGAFIGRGGR